MNSDNLDTDLISHTGSTNLSSVNFINHIIQYIQKQWIKFFLTYIAFLGGSFAIIEIIIYFFKIDLANKMIFIPLIFISFLFALIISVKSYINIVPIGLENESKIIRRIGHIKKLYWEYDLAYTLLAQNIKLTDQKFDEILNNQVFIKTKKSLSIVEYTQWLQNRPSNLIKMINVAKNLMINELFSCLISKKGEEVDINRLVQIIKLIQKLYEDAYNFEVEGKEYVVPEIFQQIHNIQSGWTEVIRDTIQQLLAILKEISTRKKDNEEPIIAEITFGELKRLKEFQSELAKIESHLPRLIAEEYNQI